MANIEDRLIEDWAQKFKNRLFHETDPRILKARRIREGVTPVKNPDGTESTVRMESGEADGKYYAYPTLFPNERGILGTVDDPFFEADKRGELFEFLTDDEAKRFAQGSWKPKEW